MRESMLLGFVEEMGHNYDHLLEGAIRSSDEKSFDDRRKKASDIDKLLILHLLDKKQ